MIKHKIKIYIVILSLLLSAPIFSAELKNIAMFGLGFASGTLFHEVGHATAVVAQGGHVKSISLQRTDTEFKNTRNLNRKLKVSALGGYVAQTLATEAILQNKNWHKNDFALGWMSLGIFVNLSNPIRYYIFGQRNNDLGHYEKVGGNPLLPAILMVTHAAVSLYRIQSNTDIPGYLGVNTFGVNLNF